MKNILLLVLLCVTATTYAQQPANSDSKNEWANLTKDNYSVKYPSAWKMNTSGVMGTSFIVLSPSESVMDKFDENVNLVIQDLTGKGITLDKYVEASRSQISTMITSSKILDGQKMKSDNGEYYKIIYIGDQQGIHLKFEQFYFIVKEKAYVITFTAEQTTFDKYKEVGEKILHSFRPK